MTDSKSPLSLAARLDEIADTWHPACAEGAQMLRALVAERDALKADADRYDFLRQRAELREYGMGHYWYIKTVDVPMGMPVMASTLANVIDHALQASKEPR